MNQFKESKKYFKTPLQEFIFFDKYSRYRDDLGRRETWLETVDRVVDFLKEISENKLTYKIYQNIHHSILNMEVMPSMRLMAMAGEAARRNGLAIYNCAFLGLNSIDAFTEVLLLGMAGCGVGYSVQKKYVGQLPVVSQTLRTSSDTHVVEDSTEGWALALKTYMTNLYDGIVIDVDYSNIRPEGSVLKIKGGRASGPKQLKEALDFIADTFISAAGRQLTTLECHDIACVLGKAVISGGVRRTALIALYDSDDLLMRHCKDGDFPEHRWFANNSEVLVEEPTRDYFDSIIDAIYEGMRGEPGLFSLSNAQNLAPKRRDGSKIAGLNPCGEVFLRDMELCNLSSVICREADTLEDLTRKIVIASVIGTIQSTIDNFPGMREDWKLNQQEERLLGVDLNGQMDCKLLREDKYGHYYNFLKEVALNINEHYAKILRINPAAAVTCVKPNGNSSQLVDSSSGLHPRHAPYYTRNVRINITSPVYKVLFEHGVPMSPENGEVWETIQTAVIHFPVKAPEGAITRKDMSALDMANFWKRNKVNYTEMNPSVTINYKPEEQDELREWLWFNRMIIGGLTVLPYSDAKYDNMPYVEITKEQYEKDMANFPEIDWSRIEYWEEFDQTTSAQEVACLSGQCEI